MSFESTLDRLQGIHDAINEKANPEELITFIKANTILDGNGRVADNNLRKLVGCLGQYTSLTKRDGHMYECFETHKSIIRKHIALGRDYLKSVS